MRALIISLVLLSADILFAQTGPAGVGSAANNTLWLKADLGTSTTVNGSAISTWGDASTNGNTASQATASQQPIYTSSLMNGMPAVFFDNASTPNNDLLSIADNNNLDNTAGLTIFTVSRPTSIDGNARAIVSKRNGVADNEAYCLFYYTSNQLNIDLETNDDRFTSVTTFNGARDYVLSVVYDGSLIATSRAKLYVNEALDKTATETASTINNNASPVTIGSMNLGDGRPFGGYISEVIIYKKALNNVERVIVHNYLFAKYGLNSASIPATTNDLYAGDDVANGDYDFEMGGIGTDATGSNGTVSTKMTGGMSMAQVSGFNNGDYIMFAHQSGSNNSNISDVGGMTGTNNARWQRIWYADITNTSTVETVNITFDMSDGGTPITPATASNYVLLERAGQSGNWTEVATANSIGGDIINFNSISISTDGYYTLGTRNYVASPLPITLVSFTGEYTEKGVKLEWITATEHNNDYFAIQRSPDGDNFTTIAKVRSTGTSYHEVTYTAIDTAPFNDRTFYRLLQTDNDGRTTNLETIAVRTPQRNQAIEVIPNPSSGKFWFDLPEDVAVNELKIFNTAGQPMTFTYTSDESRIFVDVQSLSRGLYLLKVVSDRGMHSAKFVVE